MVKTRVLDLRNPGIHPPVPLLNLSLALGLKYFLGASFIIREIAFFIFNPLLPRDGWRGKVSPSSQS